MINMNDMERVLYYYGFMDLENVQARFKIVCPFHDDLNPSMVIDLNKQSCYCFGCGVSVNAIKFVMKIEGITDILEAAVKMKAIYGKSKGKFVKEKIECNNVGFELGIKLAKEFYHSCRVIDWLRLDNHYLFDRGFEPSILNECKTRITGSYKYPIIFPMYDNGNFVGILQRTTNSVIASRRKYLYNSGFSREKAVVGKYFKDWAIITEGYLDKVKFNQFGMSNVAAILGWKITKKQAIKLRLVTNKIVCALDNTPSGEDGYKYLKKLGFEVVRFPFPEDIKDPGEMNKYVFNKAYKELKKEIIKYERRLNYAKRKQVNYSIYQKNSKGIWWS